MSRPLAVIVFLYLLYVLNLLYFIHDAMTHRKNPHKANGHARPQGRANGHEAVASPPNGAAKHLSREKDTGTHKGSKGREVPPGQYALPDDPAEFVEEIHRKIDLTEVWHALLRQRDVKIKQRAVEKLTEMRYRGAAALEEPQQIVFDIDSAVARRAAEGAKK